MGSLIPPADAGPGKRRILVIDDNVAIHRDFRKILCPETLSKELDELDQTIFGPNATPRPPKSDFVLHAVPQGQEGREAAPRMLQLGRPSALTFVHLPLPPRSACL